MRAGEQCPRCLVGHGALLSCCYSHLLGGSTIWLTCGLLSAGSCRLTSPFSELAQVCTAVPCWPPCADPPGGLWEWPGSGRGPRGWSQDGRCSAVLRQGCVVGTAHRPCEPLALLSLSLPVRLSPSPVCGKRGGCLGFLPQAGEHGGARLRSLPQVPWAGARCPLGRAVTSPPSTPAPCCPVGVTVVVPCHGSAWRPLVLTALSGFLPLSAAAAEAG